MSDAPTPDLADVPDLPLEEDTGDGSDLDRIVLLKTGRVRCLIAGKPYMLGRPNLGQFRDLTNAFEALTDELDALQIAYERKLVGLREREAAINAMDDGPDRDQAMLDLRRENHRLGVELTSAAEDQRLGWWKLVFSTLAMGRGRGRMPAAGAWPTWVTDVTLPHQVRAHWRQAPLAPG